MHFWILYTVEFYGVHLVIISSLNAWDLRMRYSLKERDEPDLKHLNLNIIPNIERKNWWFLTKLKIQHTLNFPLPLDDVDTQAEVERWIARGPSLASCDDGDWFRDFIQTCYLPILVRCPSFTHRMFTLTTLPSLRLLQHLVVIFWFTSQGLRLAHELFTQRTRRTRHKTRKLEILHFSQNITEPSLSKAGYTLKNPNKFWKSIRIESINAVPTSVFLYCPNGVH